MNNILFISIFLGLGLLYLILGLIFSRNIKTTSDYFLAGRKLGFWALTSTLIGTQIGGGLVLGTAADSYKNGFFGIFYSLGIVLGFLLLSFGFAAKLRSFDVETTAQLFEKVYKSVFLKKVASLISAISLAGILAAQVVGLKSLLFGIGFDSYWIVTATWLFLVFYTMVGGLKAVAASDSLQIFIIITVFASIFGYLIFQEPASFLTITNFKNIQNQFFNVNLNFNQLFATLFVPILFALIEQDLAQKFFAAKTKLIATLSALASGIVVLLFSFIPVYLGMKAKIENCTVLQNTNPMVIFIKNNFSEIILALLICAISAAITSTANSLLSAISSNISQDFDLKFIKNKLLTSKVITFFVGIITLFIGLFSQDIINIIIQSYDLMLSTLFVPIFFCFFKTKASKTSATLSIIFGGTSFIILKIYPTQIPAEIITLLFSFLGYILGSSTKLTKIVKYTDFTEK